MQLALFDLDGTISRHDTLFPFVMAQALRSPLRLLRVLIRMPGALWRYFFGGRDRGALKEALIVAGLAGMRREELRTASEQFTARLLRTGVNAEALACIAAHREQGDYLILLSASPDLYVPAIARGLGFNETICTHIAWDGMVLDGALASANRRGEEKRRSVEELRAREPGCRIIAYANCVSDLAHLQICDRGFLVNAGDAALRLAAHTKVEIGWPALPARRR